MESIGERVRNLIAAHPEYRSNFNSLLIHVWSEDFKKIWAEDMQAYPATLHGFTKAIQERKLTNIATIERHFYRTRSKQKQAAEDLNYKLT